MQFCQFNYLKKTEPSPEPKDPKQACGPSGTSSQYVASKDNLLFQKYSLDENRIRGDISLMILRTHLLLIALIVGATNERTTIDNSQNL